MSSAAVLSDLVDDIPYRKIWLEPRERERERELALKHKQEMAISCLMVSSRSGVWLYPAESLGNLLFCFLPFKFLFFLLLLLLPALSLVVETWRIATFVVVRVISMGARSPYREPPKSRLKRNKDSNDYVF